MINLTDSAAGRIKRQLAGRGSGLGLRIGVKTTGCSGLAYVLEYVDIQGEHDVVFESHGVQLYVDKKSLPFLQGVELDWVKRGLNEGFEFINPNERDRCGCGESFRV